MPEDIQEKPIKIAVKSERREQSPFERNLAKARETAIAKLGQAKSLPEFLMLSNAARELTPQRLSWVREEYEGYEDRSPSDWLADFTMERERARFEEEARIVTTLIEKVDPNSDTERVQVVVTKITQGQFPSYRTLAVFPKGVETSYDLLRITDSERDIVFMDLHTACNNQAADLILKSDTTTKFEIDNLTDQELREELGFDLSTVQNFRHRDTSGTVTGHRDEKLYLLFALKGGFSNETSRYLISDFPQK